MAILNLDHLDPTPEDPAASSGIRIIAASFGGIMVTDKIQELVTEDDTMTIDMGKIVHYLAPDPLYGRCKTLTVLYRLPGDDALYLLNEPESLRRPIHITSSGSTGTNIERLDDVSAFKRASLPDVEVVAAVYGLKRVKTASVLLTLTRFFSEMDEQGAIRMTNDFWKEDTWYGKFKTWTIFFRFTGSSKIQCVTGWEGQALETPWCRHA